MEIGKLLAPVHTLGPGKRVVLWTQGCEKNCKGCISPEFKKPNPAKNIPVPMLAGIIRSTAKRTECRGLSISGGDPFEQPGELFLLLRELRADFEDILVYTGFLYEEIRDGKLGEEAQAALGLIDVLIDGPYVEERNVPEAVLRGSDNQRILFLTEGKKDEYESYLKAGRQIEHFHEEGKISIVGILNRGE